MKMTQMKMTHKWFWLAERAAPGEEALRVWQGVWEAKVQRWESLVNDPYLPG